MTKLTKSLCVGAAAAALLFCGPSCPAYASKPEARTDRGYSPEQTASYYYTEGIKNNIMNGDPQQSVDLFKKVLEIDSTHAPTLFELATLTISEPETALRYSLRANAADTGNIWYRTQLGRLLIATQRYDSAMTVYNSLLKAAPNNPDNYRLIAMLYEQKGDPEKALIILDSAERQLGAVEMLAGYKRQLLLNMKQYDRALVEAKAMVENFPYDEDNYVELAELYTTLGQLAQAQEAYRKAQEINPNSLRVIASLNDFYKRTNDNVRFLSTAAQLFRSKEFPLETKLKFFEELTQTPNYYRDYYVQLGELASSLAITYPEDYRTVELYAKHLIAGGFLEDALSLYKSHLNDSTDRKEPFNTVIEIEAYQKRPDSVAKYTAMALQRFPSDPELYLRKGSISAYMLNNPKEAEPAYREALKYAKTDSLRSVIYGVLGDNYQTLGDYKNCFKSYEKGMKLDTTNAVIYNNYAYFLSLRNERLDKALAMTEKAIRLSPNNPTYLDTYAWVLYQLGRYEEARTPMRQAVSLDRTGNKELFLHYGDILYKLKDNFMASIYWKKALESGYDPEQIEQRLKQIE